MHTKKHNKKHNKRKHSRTKLFSGGGIEKEIEEKPSYIKYTFLMLGISTCYIVLKLTKG